MCARISLMSAGILTRPSRSHSLPGRCQFHGNYPPERIRDMATFFVLPSRQVLGQRFGAMLSALFPGKCNALWDWPELAETLAGLVEGRGNAFIVYREDL